MEKREPSCTASGNADWCSHCGKQYGVSSKNRTALWPSDLTFGDKSYKTWNTNSKTYMHLYIYSSVIYNRQDLGTARVPIGRWLDKKAVVHSHNGIVHSHKKKETLPFAMAWMGSGHYYPKWNKPVRERQIPHDLTYMWNLMIKIWWTKQKQRRGHMEQTAVRGKRGGTWVKGERNSERAYREGGEGCVEGGTGENKNIHNSVNNKKIKMTGVCLFSPSLHPTPAQAEVHLDITGAFIPSEAQNSPTTEGQTVRGRGLITPQNYLWFVPQGFLGFKE